MGHIIWDWNGTLFNDLHLLAEATSAALATIGHPAVDVETYRTHHKRPIAAFYQGLTGRDLSEDEWRSIDATFDSSYVAMLHRAELAEDALTALDEVRSAGFTQSILSMWHHENLVPLVEKLGVDEYFLRVDGNPNASPEGKADLMKHHLRYVGLPLDRVTMIGDTADDGLAARDNGVNAVLVTTGAQLQIDLESVGWPVVHSLHDAVQLTLK